MQAQVGPYALMPVRIMIVDDHEVVRNGIKALLAEEDGLTVAAEAGGVREAVERAEWARPDVVVMDIRLPDGTIRAVGAGQNLLDPAVTKAVLDRLRRGKHLLGDERLARLSAQEERILGEVADGKTNREIGVDLKLAEKTVKNYVSSILSKLEVARRAEAAAYLARHTHAAG